MWQYIFRNLKKLARLGWALTLGLLSTQAMAELDIATVPTYLDIAVKPNVMILFDNSGSMTNPVPGTNKNRMEVAREVVGNLVEDNADSMRFGITTFNENFYNITTGVGGKVVAPVGSSTQTLKRVLEESQPKTYTPLATTYYEITRYFRGLSPWLAESWPDGMSSRYESPVCRQNQKNFVLVVTDGEPTNDLFNQQRQTFESDPDNRSTDGLPQWGEPTMWDREYPANNHISRQWDGSLPGMAQFGRTLTKTHGSDSMTMEPLITYTVGFAIDNEILNRTAAIGQGEYYTADTAEELTAALNDAMSSIESSLSSATAIAQPTGAVQEGDLVYQATYSSKDWSGHLKAFKLDADGLIADAEAAWDAAEEKPLADQRDIYTYNSNDDVIDFRWDKLSGQQKNVLGSRDMLKYLRGDDSKEGTDYRQRSSWLGDIIHSSVVLVDQPPRLGSDAFNDPNGSKYQKWREDDLKDRPGVVYVGANDGMLHAFDAKTGEELFAYVPKGVFNKLPKLADQDYADNHQYYVDGPITVQPAYIKGKWRSILVGALGAGGKGVFALDVTEPESFNENSVLWDLTGEDDSGGDDAEKRGHILSRVEIAQTQEGWKAIFGNGYNSEKDAPYLFIVNLETGAVEQTVEGAGAGGADNNGLSSPAVYDANGDGLIDTIYAGDLRGVLTRFKASDGSFSEGQEFMTAGQDQPITTQPQLGPNDRRDGIIIYFGTGELFTAGSHLDTQTQSFYAVFDLDPNSFDPKPNPGRSPNLTRGDLLSRKIENKGNDKRAITEAHLSSDHYGWYMDLPESGERVVSDAVLDDGEIIFTTITPDPASCDSGGSSGGSWLMQLGDAAQSFAGQKISEGTISSPTIFNTKDGKKALALSLLNGGSKSESRGVKKTGRMSWRQLQ